VAQAVRAITAGAAYELHAETEVGSSKPASSPTSSCSIAGILRCRRLVRT
jgi:hypothetical protein